MRFNLHSGIFFATSEIQDPDSQPLSGPTLIYFVLLRICCDIFSLVFYLFSAAIGMSMIGTLNMSRFISKFLN